MKVNVAAIGCMGGCVHLPFEPNTPDIPELYGVVVESMLFDGIGVCEHNDMYYKISYPKLEDVADDEQVRRTINQHRYGYRLPDDFEIGFEDLALTFGNIEECEHSEYVSYLIDGLIDSADRLNVEDGKRTVLSIEQYCQQLREIEKDPPKYLFLVSDQAELEEVTAHLNKEDFKAIVFLKENEVVSYNEIIEQLRKELRAEIVDAMRAADIRELDIAAYNVYVVCFYEDNLGYDLPVTKVMIDNKGNISLSAKYDDGGIAYLDSDDLACRNIDWLNDIMEAVKKELITKTK